MTQPQSTGSSGGGLTSRGRGTYRSSSTLRTPPRPPADEMAAYCLLKLNRPQEALDRLAQSPLPHGAAYYFRGLALANLGRLNQAREALRQPGQGKSLEQASRQALLAVLRAQVGRLLEAKNFAGASEALGQALALAPQDKQLLAMQVSLGQQMPVVYLHSGQRDQAQQTWETSQKRAPQEPEFTHCLALSYFWQAKQLEQDGDAASSQAWRGAIRNWVTLCHHKPFWQEFRESRSKVCGEIAETDTDEMRKRMLDDLGRELAQYQNHYLEQGRREDSKRLAGLALELSAEIRTLEAAQRVADSLRRQGTNFKEPPIGGLLMLQHLGSTSELKDLLDLVRTTQSNQDSAEDLRWCMTGYLLPWTLLRESRHVEALELLESMAGQGQMEEPARRLMARAQAGRAETLAQQDDLGQALDLLEKAWNLAPSGSVERDQVREILEPAMVRGARRMQDEGKVQEAVDMLDRCLRFCDSKRLKEYISEMITSLAIKTANETKNLDAAEKLLDRALKHNPKNTRATENKAVLIINRAIDVANKGNLSRGVDMMREAQRIAPDLPYLRRSLSDLLSGYGVERYNRGSQSEGRRLLEEALRLNPNNQHARKNLLLTGGGNPEDMLRALLGR